MSVMPVQKAPTLSQPTATTANAAVARFTTVTAASIANRQALPQGAAAVDQLRAVFKTDQVQVVYAGENGRELGREPPLGVIAHPPRIPHSRVNRPDGARSAPPGLPTVNRL